MTGKTIGSLEKLQELLLLGTDLFNEPSYIDMQVRNKAKREAEEFGLERDRILPFFNVDLTSAEIADVFLDALKPLYNEPGYPKLSADNFGFIRKQYNMKQVEFGDKFDIRGNELVTTDAHEQERNKACERHATTTQQMARVKIAVDFIKPFKEMEKHITSKEVKLRKRIWIALSCMYCQNFRRKKRTYAECRIR